MEEQLSQATEALPPQTEAKEPSKPKKERSEAQKAATAKALAAMTARRKEQIEHRKAKKEEVKLAKKVVEEKIIKEDLAFAHKGEVEAMKKELAELRGMFAASRQDKPAAAPKQERIVERVIERVPTPSAQPARLSGYELLDKVFFNK